MRSLSARRAWIEIFDVVSVQYRCKVALRKESVDRNLSQNGTPLIEANVALRKESVDRNIFSLPLVLILLVALRKESVDRNHIRHTASTRPSSRSPQGERG